MPLTIPSSGLELIVKDAFEQEKWGVSFSKCSVIFIAEVCLCLGIGLLNLMFQCLMENENCLLVQHPLSA